MELAPAYAGANLFIIRKEFVENHPNFIYDSSEIGQLSKNDILNVLSELE
jgi:hypothetical protein